jgi:S1-C subfamily serine protease
MGILTTLSADLAAAVASAGQSVVRVEGRRHGPASGTVWSADGLIVTANHVLTKDEDIAVGLADGKSVQANVVGRDPTTDLALIRIDGKAGGRPGWVDAEAVRVGHIVLALGRPGAAVRAAMGIVSALGESWRTPAGGSIDAYLQADMSSYPGFSGGPLVTADGEILGINTSGLLRGTTVTVPTTSVRQVVEELLERGRVSRGYLGVGIQPARLPPQLGRRLGQETGLLIISVDPGSPAEQAGLVLGDTILALGGEPVRHWDDLIAGLGKDRIGVMLDVRMLRAGRLREIKVTIGERP